MPYIGRQLARGQNRKIDDISGSFNGILTTFNLRVNSEDVYPASTNQLWVSLGGVIQNPNTDYTVSSAQITFTTAPASELDFFAIMQGDAVDINTPADGSVTTTKLGSNLTINVADGTASTPSIQFNSSGTDTGFYSPATDEVAVTVSGSEALKIDSSGRFLVGTSSDSGGALLQVSGDRIRVGIAKTPASASDTGTAGEICWDASYIYVCIATNTWKRTAISTW